ncbi:hypothetical protein HanRHA438_Chr03g0125311 [Helianthus annuus]|nr:hypothetical protein HanRHA438_Chr03g0125311 [Helianthus annuus]
MELYTGIPWYSNKDVFSAAVRFLYFGAKAVIASSSGQKTVTPASTLLKNVPIAPEVVNRL